LFDTLIDYGRDFPQDFWDTLWRQLLYPIFMVLKSKSEMSKVLNHEELSVWLSTTMIEALRHMIKLFTHFFSSLEYMLDRFLELLALCICQENDTLARIGSNCLQQLILENVNKFEPQHWHKIVNAFVELFKRTEATALFSAATTSSFTPTQSQSNGVKSDTAETSSISDLTLMPSPTQDSSLAADPEAETPLGLNGLPTPRQATVSIDDDAMTNESSRGTSPMPKRRTEQLEDYRPDNELQQAPVVVTAARRRFFNQIITKCVLQLLMIETVQELFMNDSVYKQIPSQELLRLMQVLKRSYQFAKKFNADRELRTRLFKEGFMKQPPNLLKQESGSAAVYVSILFRMFHDTSTERAANRAETEAALVPLCEDIVQSYIELDDETQQRNIITWRPVVVNVLDGFVGFPEEEFKRMVPMVASLVVGLMGTEMTIEVQRAVQALTARSFEVGLGVRKDWDLIEKIPASPTSTGTVKFGRRSSKGR
jgi:brefeldin A-inhibited guanine nucleotide-exchange protein